jgi:hypothetical protein
MAEMGDSLHRWLIVSSNQALLTVRQFNKSRVDDSPRDIIRMLGCKPTGDIWGSVVTEQSRDSRIGKVVT